MTITALYKITATVYGGFIEPTYAGDTVHHITIDLQSCMLEAGQTIEELTFSSREVAFKAAFIKAFGEEEYNDSYR